MRNLREGTTVVVGASRGFGRSVAAALAEAGADVVAVARDKSRLEELAAGTPGIRYKAVDAGLEGTAEQLLGEDDPDTVVLVAGASPRILPLQEQTWDSFSLNWNTDVRIAFQWLRAILLQPLRPGSRVVVLSSGAAVAGSPLSGGYAGAKATQRFITAYAHGESKRAGLGITFTTVLPRPAPATDIGKAAIEAYAAHLGISQEAYIENIGGAMTPEMAGTSLVELARAEPEDLAEGYLLTATGLQKLA